MKTIILLAVVALPCLFAGFIAGKSTVVVPVDPKPVLYDDMRAIVAALEPFENGADFDRVSVCVRSKARSKYSSQATVGIEFHPKQDTKFYGWGDDIPSAIANLTAGGGVVSNVLAPFAEKR